jgi:hypothetical protein
MEIVLMKKYELTEEEKNAVEMAISVLRGLEYGGFDSDFIDRKDTYLGNVICDLKGVLEMDGVDWND